VTKVAICLPHQDMVQSGTSFDLIAMSAYWVARHGYESYCLLNVAGTLIPSQRAQLAQAALDQGCDWLLWVDSDMRFPKESLDRLMSHKQPIVACNYTTRRPPLKTTAFKELGGEPVTVDSMKATGLEEVAGCGMGLMLTSAEVFRKTPKPWFALMYSTVNDAYHGEDLFFTARAAEQGFKTMIDHDLSREIGHTGQLTYRHEFIG
jgi:hypothetical protein